MSEIFLIAPVFLPFLLGAVLYLIPFRSQRSRNLYVMASLLCSAACVWLSAFLAPERPLVLLRLMGNMTFSLKLDGAGKLFSCLSATLWPITALYSFDYMKHEEHHQMFYCFFVMAFGATMGIAMAGNILTMYLFYEMLTLTTIPLVLHGMTKKHNRATRKYMAYSIGGAAFAFPCVAYLIVNGAGGFVPGGSLTAVDDQALAQVLYVLAFLGFGVKAALFPFHGWLPTASVAPTPVTALLHAVAVVKAGAFALIRLTYYAYGTDFLRGTPVQYIVMTVAMFTILYGSATALRQNHFKRRLAYSTVSNLSYIAFAVTLMTPAGLAAAFCHLIFHSVIKIGAFFAAGSVLHNTGREFVPQLEGIGRKMPWTFGFFTVFALALTGIPPFCGFFSKWYICSAALEAGSGFATAGVIVLLVSALLTALYMLSPAIKAFFPRQGVETDLEGVKEANWKMLVPMGICAVLCVVLGIFAAFPVQLITEVLGV